MGGESGGVPEGGMALTFIYQLDASLESRLRMLGF